MDKWSLNKLEIKAINSEINENIIRSLMTPVASRKNFKYNSYVVTIPIYFYRFIGIKENEEKFYTDIAKLDRELRALGSLYLRVSDGLNRDISISIQNAISDVWNRCVKDGNIDSEQMFIFLDSNNLFPKIKNVTLSKQIKSNLRALVDYYLKSNKDIDINKFKIMMNYMIHWINHYCKELFDKFNYSEMNPKVLFYGDISIDEIFFLIFLSTLGCDVLYFNTNETGSFDKIDKLNYFSREILYHKRAKIRPFPETINKRVGTAAFKAKKEIGDMLFSEESKFYRPWQFAEYRVNAVTLKTTYEEIFIWAKEKAYIRDGWNVSNNEVYIPNIFAKVSGTHDDIDKYWKEIDSILNQKQVKFYNKLPITAPIHMEYGKFNEVHIMYGDSSIDVNKMINSSWWKYRELRTGLQISIAEKINELCTNPVIINRENEDFSDFQVEIFSVLINLDTSIMQMLQGNDYPQEVPKIVIYNNEKNGNLSFEDCVMLAFMNYMGIDIIIFNPSGYNDIENYIYSDLYDVHILENMRFELDFQKYDNKKGFFKRLFKRKGGRP
ncbi:hypothetical protein CLTEP_05330 [Clostridium tepidiprofundi DSM 19306]|uniref:Putative component of 'biosynthetic module' domain-containing protein n=1 Tax=Clostridium tepidiprofundi DSM 19306 TaxID=1121338 RepID=A0A151B6R4_9CLOT|nr:YceG family protein [Clostridium tepidiprofundi]KYH35589.1 hypothetical protein CLTEP_05330 [Clostridium tepidiprofundi DSM 19306]